MAAKRERGETSRRHIVVAMVFLAWSGGIVWRLIHLQITRHDEFARRSETQRRRELKLTPPRGDIVDRKGNILADSVISTTVYADPNMIRAQRKSAGEKSVSPVKEPREAKLSREKGKTRTYEEETALISSVLARITREKDSSGIRQQLERDDTNYVRLCRRLDPEQTALVRAAIAEQGLIGIGLEEEPIRMYPNKQLASHVMGFVNNDEDGVSGIELEHNKELQGSGGTVRLESDALGRPFERRDESSRKGATVVTTIDLQLQSFVDEALKLAVRETKSRAASALVLEVATGEVLALANYPTFDPNVRLRDGDAKKTERELDARRNRAISDYFEPGSVFKIVTFSAALEEGLITPEKKVSADGGSIHLFGRSISDHVSGTLTASQALAKSSNVVSIKLALGLSHKRSEQWYVDFISRFGFGKLTGIDLPGEIRGVVHPPDRWSKTSIASIAIGQEVGVTVLQVASAMASIANGGIWVQPHVVKKIVSVGGQTIFEAEPEKRQAISVRTARDIKGMLEQVILAGTARHAVKLTGYTAAGKTGTPQKIDPATRRYSHTKFMPTFAGFVPASEPRFAIIVMLDEPIGLHQGGQVSAPVFKSIAETALLDYAVSPDSPEFKASLGLLAARLRGQADREVETGTGETIASNSPQPPATSFLNSVAVPASDAVTTRSGEAPGAMPDFRGRTLREVAQACRRKDLRVRMVGTGIAVSQKPDAGKPVQAGDLCVVEFK
jgi:cell division protein FtsI/penicillin-binding protein 2